MALITQNIVQAARETSPVPDGSCKACERSGTPILPLRWAVVSKTAGLQALSRLTNSDTQLSMRMLRAGYLYVLLDGSVWQAYQVSPEGCLRQFNPYDAPHGDPAALPEQCTTQGHDVRSSFIHIDTKRYSQAQVAFANDAWPASVLDAYKKGADAVGKPLAAGYTERFVTYTLSTLKSEPTPAAHALPLLHGFEMENTIAEFAFSYADFGSVHGFHSRVGRLEAMQMYLRQAEKLHGLDKGVAGLMLPDPIGLAQELNGLVRSVQTQRQLWAQDEAGTEVVTSEGRQIVRHLRPYQYLTSQCLLGINALYARQADAETPDSPTPLLDHTQSESGSPPVFRDPARERAEIVKHKTDKPAARLQERYDEDARKAFQDAYDKQMAEFQRAIDVHGKDWAAQIVDPAWRRSVQLDYTGTDIYSSTACVKAVASCLAGGPSEAFPPSQPPGQARRPEALGPTVAAWKALLEDAESPVYAALLAQNGALHSAFVPIFSGGKLPNEAGKKYFDAIKGIIGSREISTLRERAVREAADALLAAMHNASSRLEGVLSEGVKAAVNHIHSGSALLYADLHLTQVKVELTVREYYNLLSQQLKNGADRAANALGKHPRTMMFYGLIGIPSPAVRDVVIEVTLWARGTAEQIKREIGELASGARASVRSPLRKLVAGVSNLEPRAMQVLHGIQISASDARQFAGKSLFSLRSLANGSVDGNLVLLSLYFQADTLKTNLAAIDKAIGVEHPEAVSAMYGAAVGVFGASLEAAALSVQLPAEAARAFVLRGGVAETPALTRVIGVGRGMLKVAGSIGAVTGLADGIGHAFAGVRTWNRGDAQSGAFYIGAGALSLTSSAFGVAAAAGSGGLLGGMLGLGPLGWALILSVAAYSAARYAKTSESSPLERWARRCYFGDHKERPTVAWLRPSDIQTAIAELNAAVLGMDVALGFNQDPRVIDQVTLSQMSVEEVKHSGGWEKIVALKYRIVLPDYDPEVSSYLFELVAQRFGLRGANSVLRDKAVQATPQTLASGEHNSSTAASSISQPPRIPDYAEQASTAPTLTRPVISGGFLLEKIHSIKSVTLAITYWPDKEDVEGFARVELSEVAP